MHLALKKPNQFILRRFFHADVTISAMAFQRCSHTHPPPQLPSALMVTLSVLEEDHSLNQALPVTP